MFPATEVKVALTSVAFALAGYQLVLAAVGYRGSSSRVRRSARTARPAT